MKPFSFYFLLFSLFFLFLPGTPACAQSTVTGRDFWVGFLHNGYKDSVQHAGSTILTTHQTLVVLSQSAGTVTASCQLWSVTETLVPGVAKTISVPYEDTYSGPVGLYTRPSHSRRPNYGAIHVTSTTDITLYALNNEPGRSSEPDRSADATLVLPTASLGRHYLLQDFLPITSTDSISPWDGGAFCIVATRNNTSVDILFHNDVQIDTFQYNTNAYQPLSHTLYAAGSHFRTVTLNRGQYIQFLTPPGGSFSGTEVTADSPVALFMGRKYAAVPNALNQSPDHLYQQAMPVERWGRKFLVVPDHRAGTALDYLSIATLDDGCQLSFTTVAAGESYTSQTLQAGQTLLLHMPADHSPLLVSATKPIALSLYLAGHAGRGNLGDPSVIAVPPLNQTTASARLFTRFDTNHANIVVPTAAVSGMRLDGVDISSLFTPFASTPYSFASLPVARSAGVTTGSHLLTNLSGQFNAWCYGFNPEASFASPVGMSLRNLRQELLVAGLPNYTWGDTVPLCGLTQHFAIHTDGETDTRWYVDNVLQSSTDTALDVIFSSAGLHTITALQRGGCTAPDFCDTLNFLVRLSPQAIAPTTQQVYVDQFPYTLNGITYDSAGSYTQHLTAANGCDSVVHLTLSARLHANNDTVTTPAGVPVVILPTLNDSIDCPNPTVNIISYAWHGSIAVHDGNHEGYRDDYDDILGKDSSSVAVPPQEVVYYQDPELFYDPTWTGLDSIQIVVICDNDNRDTSWIFVRVVNPTDTFAVVCGDFVWYGDTLTASGTRYHTIRSSSGEDSILRLHLTVNRSTTGDTTATACDSFIWWVTGETYSADTILNSQLMSAGHQPILNSQGCDSTVTLHLTVYNTIHQAVTETACDSLTWNCTAYTVSGDYTYIHIDANGCTQVDTLHLTVFNTNHAVETETACDSLLWNGTTYTATGIYTYSHTDANGCTQVDTLHLTVFQTNHTTETETVCDSMSWNGIIYTATGNYTYSHIDANGCTQVDALHLTVNYSSTGIEDTTACNSFVWHGTEYTESTNTPVHVYTNTQGCESTVTLHLTINPCSSTTITACDSYTWNETTYTASGIYDNGIDTLYLIINNSTSGIFDTTVCDSLSWWNTNFTNSTNTAMHTIVGGNTVGCDSTVTLHLTVNHSSTGDTSAVACDSFSWYDANYTSSASPTHTFTNTAGCDSTVTLSLTINNSNTGDTIATACDTFSWYGTEYMASASLTHAFTNATGCDSVVTFNLTINYSSTGIEDTTACNSFVWHGTEYTESTNTPVHVYTNTQGCDSTVTLHLTINPCSATTITACDSYTWNETTYTVSGIYNNGIDTLYLTINYSTSGDTAIVACDGYTWIDGQTYTSSTDTPTYTLTNAAECDSVVTLALTINQSTIGDTIAAACDSFTWYGTDFTASSTPMHTFTNAAGCDSVVTLALTIFNSNTGDTSVTFCDSFTWYGTEYTSSTNTPIHVYTNTQGCDSTVTLHLTVNHSSTGDTTAEACNSFTWWNTGETYIVDTFKFHPLRTKDRGFALATLRGRTPTDSRNASQRNTCPAAFQYSFRL